MCSAANVAVILSRVNEVHKGCRHGWERCGEVLPCTRAGGREGRQGRAGRRGCTVYPSCLDKLCAPRLADWLRLLLLLMLAAAGGGGTPPFVLVCVLLEPRRVSVVACTRSQAHAKTHARRARKQALPSFVLPLSEEKPPLCSPG